MSKARRAFLIIGALNIAGAHAAAAQGIPADRVAPKTCPYVGVPYLEYWKCMAAMRRTYVVHALHRSALPHDALHITMKAGRVWVSAGATDSVYWYLGVTGRGVDTQDLPDVAFHAGPTAAGFEMRINEPDSFPEVRGTALMIFVPTDLKALQVDVGTGSVLVSSLNGDVTITVEKGSVDVSALTGPALIENRDGPIKVNVSKVRYGQESLLKASLNVLGRNGDIDLTLPETTHANLTVEAHQGAIVDSPFGLTTRRGDGDTIQVQLRPALGLKDNELRSLHRALNGGGPDIKIVTLNGNVTIREYIAPVKPQ